MNRILKSFIVVAILFSFGFMNSAQASFFNDLGATIFEGTAGTDDPEGVGFCLRYPDHSTCADSDYGTICKNPDYYNSLRCLSEAEVGIGITEEGLAGSGITHTQTASDLIIKYVNFMLPYLALAAFVGYVVAGFFYVTAYGNQEQLDKAKKILIWSTVGLIIVIASFTIVQFFTSDLVEQLQPL
ncbi:pilin [Patescibacteria group bacterium]|nr:pilin [Patescibacteria group bacterium]MBU1683539.1 pilin [Patescibacteria group bacterium]MBU1935009.1 pilin [Patescibacteria group bacterium]